jgi:kinesin family member 5
LIACSPHSFNVEETIGTLKFGQRAKSIKTSARINQTRSVAELEAIIAKMTKELDFWKAYATELETVIREKFDPNFDFQELKKRIIAALARNEAPVEVIEEAESMFSPPTSPRRAVEDDDSPAPSAPTSPAGVAAVSDDEESVGMDSRAVIEMQLNLEKVKENLQLKIQDLHEDLKLVKSDRDEQVQRLARQQQELEEAQSLLKKEREEHQMRLQAFEYELKKLSSTNDEKSEAVERALKDAVALKEQLEAVVTSKAAIEAERNKFHGFLSQAKADVLRWREEASKSQQLETKLFQLAERFQAQDDRRAELESFVTNSQTQNETIRLQLDAKEHENAFLEGEVQRLRQKLQAMEEQTELIKEDLHKKLMEKTSQASALSADAAAAAETARISSKRSGDAATLESDLADARRLNIQLQSDIAIKDVKVREMQTRLEEMAKEGQRTNGRLDTEKAAFIQLEKRFQEVESQLHAQQITKEAIDADLSESKRNASALENQLSVARAELERAQKDSAAQVQRLQKQLDQANERVAELESTRDKMYDQNADLKSLLDTAKAQIAQLTASAAAAAAAASLSGSSSENLSRTSTPVGSLSSSILSEDSFEELETSAKPARGGNIRKPITKTLSGAGAAKKGPSSPVKPSSSTSAAPPVASTATQTPKKPAPASTAAAPVAPAAPSTPTSGPSDAIGTPSPSGTGTRTKKEKGFFGRIFGDTGPTKRYVSEVKTKEGTLWTHVGMMSTWKSHTFMLWDNNMHGWRPSSADLDKDADVTIRIDGVTVKVADAPVKSLGHEGAYQFTLTYPNRKQIILGATSSAEALSWVAAINEYNARIAANPLSGTTSATTSSDAAETAATVPEPSAAIPVPAPVPVAVPDPDVLSSSTPKK